MIVGIALGLLPPDRELTDEDRRVNAGRAILGVLLLAVATLIDVGERICEARRKAWGTGPRDP